MLGNYISEDRIRGMILQLNGIRHVELAAFNASGIGEDGEYNEILDSGVLQLGQHLKQLFRFSCVNDTKKLFAV